MAKWQLNFRLSDPWTDKQINTLTSAAWSNSGAQAFELAGRQRALGTLVAPS